MTTAVIGATGVVGSEIVRGLLARGDSGGTVSRLSEGHRRM
jgi:nucleoside-diphosphate-sugar epimerase